MPLAKDCQTTSLLIDQDVLLDAETGAGNLSFAEMHITSHIFLTHSHLGHIAVSPPMVDAIAAHRTSPVQIHALQATMDTLKLHTFQQRDLARFLNKSSLGAPFIHFLISMSSCSWQASTSRCCQRFTQSGCGRGIITESSPVM